MKKPSNKVSFNCPKCGEALRAKVDQTGLTDHCPKCMAQFIVPDTGAKAAWDEWQRVKAETDEQRQVERREIKRVDHLYKQEAQKKSQEAREIKEQKKQESQQIANVKAAQKANIKYARRYRTSIFLLTLITAIYLAVGFVGAVILALPTLGGSIAIWVANCIIFGAIITGLEMLNDIREHTMK